MFTRQKQQSVIQSAGLHQVNVFFFAGLQKNLALKLNYIVHDIFELIQLNFTSSMLEYIWSTSIT